MIVGLYILIVFQALSAIGSIALIDDKRKPRTKSEAITSVIVSSLIIAFYILLINALRNK